MDRELALDSLLKSWADEKRLTPAEAKALGDAAAGRASDLSVDWWRKVFLRASVALVQANDFRTYLRLPAEAPS